MSIVLSTAPPIPSTGLNNFTSGASLVESTAHTVPNITPSMYVIYNINSLNVVAKVLESTIGESINSHHVFLDN